MNAFIYSSLYVLLATNSEYPFLRFINYVREESSLSVTSVRGIYRTRNIFYFTSRAGFQDDIPP